MRVRQALSAQRCILNTIGGQYLERWPEEILRAVFGAHKYSYEERRVVGKFLYGNLRDVELVYGAMRPRLGNQGNHAHLRSYLRDLASGKYDAVPHCRGTRRRAYGLANDMEFFASLAVPLLGGRNDYFPYTREAPRLQRESDSELNAP